MPRRASGGRLWRAAMSAPIFAATIDHRQTDGQVAELQQALNLAANQVPLELLETRAVTPAPGEVQASQAAIEPYVFPGSVAEFLAIPRPTVGVGEAGLPDALGATTVHAPDKGAAAGETTGEFAAEKLSPARLQASFFYSREDAASFVGMADSLRSTLSEALSDGLDRQILVGANGLLAGNNLAHVAAAARTTYMGYRRNWPMTTLTVALQTRRPIFALWSAPPLTPTLPMPTGPISGYRLRLRV